MATIAHPDTDGSLEVNVIDRESHRGNEYVQIESNEDGINISDQSGASPWFPAEEVEE